MNIKVSEPCLTGLERKYLTEAFDSGFISGAGSFVSRLESEFAAFCGVGHSTTVSNGTVALHVAIRALGLSAGDEVIVPNFNGIYGVYALLYEGIIPVPVDADRDTWNIDVTNLESKINSKTKAIMMVHMYGNPCDYDEILEIAKRHNLYIIEDAAEAHGASYKSRKIGSLGDMSSFSFYANKIITSGEGGIVLSNSCELIDRVRKLKNQGFPLSGVRDFIFDEISYNYRYTNLQAAIACAQLERILEILSERDEIRNRYQKILSHTEGISFQKIRPYSKSVNWMTCILVDEYVYGHSRNDLEFYLASNGVETRRLFVGMNRQPVLKRYSTEMHMDDCIFPTSDYLADNGLYLPTYNTMEQTHISYICELIDRYKS